MTPFCPEHEQNVETDRTKDGRAVTSRATWNKQSNARLSWAHATRAALRDVTTPRFTCVWQASHAHMSLMHWSGCFRVPGTEPLVCNKIYLTYGVFLNVGNTSFKVIEQGRWRQPVNPSCLRKESIFVTSSIYGVRVPPSIGATSTWNVRQFPDYTPSYTCWRTSGSTHRRSCVHHPSISNDSQFQDAAPSQPYSSRRGALSAALKLDTVLRR